MRIVLGTGLLVVLASAALPAEHLAELHRQRISMPVTIQPCEHVIDAIVYIDGEPSSSLPGVETFVFSYYADVGVTLPEAVRIDVDGKYADTGESFAGSVTVTLDEHQITSPRSELGLSPTTVTLSCDRERARPVDADRVFAAP